MPGKYFSQLVQKIRRRSERKLIEDSKLFDGQWYLAEYLDVAKSGVDPLMHFLVNGAKEGRDPNPLFDAQWYVDQYPEVAKAGANPLVHYIDKGVALGYDPNPLFDTDWYLEKYLNNAKDNNPLTHYLSTGAAENYNPSPYFSNGYYINQNPDIAKLNINALAHYLRRGTEWLEKIIPGSLERGPTAPFPSTLSEQSTQNQKILFISHDASPTGAPVLLLSIIKSLKELFGIEAAVILLTGGDLEEQFKDIAKTYVVHEEYKLEKNYHRFKQFILQLWKDGYRKAFCNTGATGKCTQILYRAGFIVVSAVHEMRSVISAMKLEQECLEIARYSHKVIFPAKIVCNEFEALAGKLGDRIVINPQGLLMMPQNELSARQKVCESLNVSSNSILILAVGLGDLRKGFDLYLQLVRNLGVKDNRYQFIWIGNMAPALEPWFKLDIETPLLRRCFHNRPFTSELSLFYQAADVFVLTSREDPMPSVVIDALAHGLPVIAFDKCGGYVDLLASKKNGELVDYGDINALSKAIESVLNDKTMYTAEAKKERSDLVIKEFDFEHYATNIIRLFSSELAL